MPYIGNVVEASGLVREELHTATVFAEALNRAADRSRRRRPER